MTHPPDRLAALEAICEEIELCLHNHDSGELNLRNFNEDDVAALNYSYIEVVKMLEKSHKFIRAFTATVDREVVEEIMAVRQSLKNGYYEEAFDHTEKALSKLKGGKS